MSNELDLVILKNLITNKRNALDFVSECDTKLFDTSLWNFAHVVCNYIKAYREVPTLKVISEKIAKSNNKLLGPVTNIWEQLDKIEIDDREYKFNLEKLKKRFAEKQLMGVKEQFSKLDEGNVDVNRSVTDLQKTIQAVKSLDQIKAFDRRSLKDEVSVFRDEYNAKLKDSNFDAGIKTGYAYLDKVTGGLRPGELFLIGGESGSGKSMLLMNMAVQIWLQSNKVGVTSNFAPGYDVMYFSLEMPLKPCRNRILARLSGTPTNMIRDAKLDTEGMDSVKKALRFINKYPNTFEIVDMPRGATIENIELIYEEAKLLYDPKIIVIDYLGLMEYSDKDMEDWLKLGKISELCHEFSRVHNVTVLSAVQLNRSKAKETEDKVGMHRIGRSALIMHNANNAIQINKRQKEQSFPDLEYHVIKCREGELGAGRMIKNMKCASLLDVAPEESDTDFKEYESGDISAKLELLDI